MMTIIPIRVYVCFITLLVSATLLAAGKEEKPPTIYPAAVLGFSARGTGVKDQGENISDIIFATLSAEQPQLVFVERKEVDHILKELKLSASGVVAREKANRIGQLVGAKILITGSVFRVGTKNYIVAKIMGTETSRVDGVSESGVEEIATLAERLARKVGERIIRDGPKLMPPARTREKRITALMKALAAKTLPPCTIKVTEKHIGQPTGDPAAQTELTFLYRKLGGVVVDPGRKDPKQVEITVTGEGVSEYAGEINGLKSVKARVEIKVLSRQGKVLAVERQVVAKVGVTEALAGKEALQEAAAEIAIRLLPKLAK